MIKVLHFSPVRKPPEIVKLHLESLAKINSQHFQLDLSFFDDNNNAESTAVLVNFVKTNSNAFLHDFPLPQASVYQGSKRWHPTLYSRITEIKNRVINYFINNDYDYLFLTDSDLIIQPETLKNLLRCEKDFVSSIFWTHFDRSESYTPNAWYAKHLGFEKDDLLKLKEPGTYQVDFTGACTLLSRNILKDGVSFKKIPILNYLGEDKHFCIRASVLGYEAFVNTEAPVFHVYKEEDIELGRKLLGNNFKDNYLENWLDPVWENKMEKWLKPPKNNFLKKIITKLF